VKIHVQPARAKAAGDVMSARHALDGFEVSEERDMRAARGTARGAAHGNRFAMESAGQAERRARAAEQSPPTASRGFEKR